MKRFVCFLSCLFIAASAAFAESAPVPAAAPAAEAVSETETPVIENEFWLSDDYTLNAWRVEKSGEYRVEIYWEDPKSGDHVLWQFLCGAGSKPDALLAEAFTVKYSTYDQDNLLVQDIHPEQACETRFILDEKDQVTVYAAPDADLEGRVFRRLDDSGEESGEFFELKKGQEWFVWFAPYECMTQFRPVKPEGENWFWIYALPANVYAFFEPYQDQEVFSYLILGEERALLWDSGMGISDIRKSVERLTDLPVTVLNSHDHFDHTGGNYLFDNVMCYNIPSAVKTLTEGQSHQDLLEYMNPALIINRPEDFDAEHFYRIGKAPTATVEDGQVIDLGGRKLEVLYTPGHSADSIMLIDEANGILFTGDTWYPGPLYAFMEDSSLPDYVASMRKAEKVIQDKKITWLFPSHNDVTSGTELFFETTDFLQDVLDGEIEYINDDGMKYYQMDSVIGLYMK